VKLGKEGTRVMSAGRATFGTETVDGTWQVTSCRGATEYGLENT
jgi:hypothetical protein